MFQKLWNISLYNYKIRYYACIKHSSVFVSFSVFALLSNYSHIFCRMLVQPWLFVNGVLMIKPIIYWCTEICQLSDGLVVLNWNWLPLLQVTLLLYLTRMWLYELLVVTFPYITDCRRTYCSEIPRVESWKAWEGTSFLYMFIVYFQSYGICIGW